MIDAKSIIRGISNEKPADDRLLLMAHIWSAYEVTGEVTMKIGAKCWMVHLIKDMVLRARQLEDKLFVSQRWTGHARIMA